MPIVATGGDTVKVRVAGVESWLPAASWARNETVWRPFVRPAKVIGLAQSTYWAESSRHMIFEVSPAGAMAQHRVLRAAYSRHGRSVTEDIMKLKEFLELPHFFEWGGVVGDWV